MVRLHLLFALLAFTLSGCGSASKDAGREPNQAAAGAAAAVDPAHSPEFLSHEVEPRRHTFIFMDPKSHFGYHVNEYKSPHQHQLIVRSQMTIPGKNEKQLIALLSNPTADKDFPFFSVTTNEPKFQLREIFEGDKRKVEATLYDSYIVGPKRKIVNPKVQFEILNIIKHDPMVADETAPANLTYIVFGSYGKAKKTYYLAHLIQGQKSELREKNFDQLLVVDFEKDVIIDNGSLMVLNQPDVKPLDKGATYEGSIGGAAAIKFKVTKQTYLQDR